MLRTPMVRMRSPREVSMSWLGRLPLRNALFAVVFGVAMVMGRLTRLDHSDISLVWPAAAISAIWMLGVRSRRDALGATAGLVGAAFVTSVLVGVSPGLSLGFAIVNLIIGGGTALLLNRHRGAHLREPEDLAWLLVSVTVATGVAALLGGLLMHVARDAPMWRSTFIFWSRNGVTTLAGVALMATFPARPRLWSPPSRRRLLGDLAMWAFAITVYAVVFVVNDGTPVGYFILPVAVVVALRWSTARGTWFTIGTGALALVATLYHRGPFVGGDLLVRAALAQGLVGCALVIVLTVGLYRDSRARLLAELAEAHRETQDAAEQLHYSAMHDSLTGLANRQQLMDVLDAAVVRARESHTVVGVVFLDLDGFKAVNDTYGHAEGDLLLDAVATRLRLLVRPNDLVARLGGDEFVMVCTGLTPPGQLDAITDRISSTLSLPYDLASGHVHANVAVSLGTAVSDPTSTAAQLVHDADSAMYDAKRSRQVPAA